MGFTRYWTRTEKPLTEEFVDAVRNIIALAEDKGIHICGGNGDGEPMISTEQIWINGDATIGADHESFYLATDQPAEWDFCKTAEKPYDFVVKRILETAKAMEIVKNVDSDGECEEMTDVEWVDYCAEMRKKYPYFG